MSTNDPIPGRTPHSVFGSLLQELIAATGKTQAEVAQAAEMSEAGISHLVNGLRKPRLRTLLKIRDALSLDEATFDRMRRIAGRENAPTEPADWSPEVLRRTQDVLIPKGSLPGLSVENYFPVVSVHPIKPGRWHLIAELVPAKDALVTLPGRYYIRIEATGGQSFSWLDLEPDNPPRELIVTAQYAQVMLGVGTTADRVVTVGTFDLCPILSTPSISG